MHAHIWDVGIRPLSPVLIEMANALDASRTREIKAKWLDVWERLLLPFSQPGTDLGVPRPAAEIAYVVGKS